ncbi:MAG: alpha/beta hydrolase, partial [Balneolales bacterium]
AANTLIVFLYGAGLNASIWDNLLPHLNYPTLAVEYPNRGMAGNVNKSLTLEDYHREILDQLSHRKERNVLIVAHSIGGIFCNKLGVELKDRLVGIVAVGAIMTEKGTSFLSAIPWLQRIITQVLIKSLGTRPPDSQIKKGLCHDLPDEVTRKIVSDFTPESPAIYTEPIPDPVPKCSALYIMLNDDKSISIPVQKKSAARLLQANTVALDTGHLPMISQPEKLAGLITGFLE